MVVIDYGVKLCAFLQNQIQIHFKDLDFLLLQQNAVTDQDCPIWSPAKVPWIQEEVEQ